MAMRAVVIAIAMSACAAAKPAAAPARAAIDGAAWDRLTRALPGTWSMTTASGRELRVAYKLISNGSALVEDWNVGSNRETETVFHPDQQDILLTHYCAQGNQPRLRAVAASPGSIAFKLVDVTNQRPDQAVLVERRLAFDGDRLDDTEIYRQPNGSDESTTYRLVRVSPEHASPP